MSILIRNGTLLTLGDHSQVLHDHDLFIEQNRIEAIAPTGTLVAPSNTSVIEANGRVVMPGFINAHMHYYSSFARGLSKAEPASDFNGVLKNLWWRLDKALTLDDCEYSAKVAMIDAIKHGTTTLIDHHASPFAARDSLHVIAKAALGTGVRNVLCYEVSDRDGEKIADDGLIENANFIRHCKDHPNELLSAMFGLHASFTIGDKTLSRAAKLVHELNVGVHIHVAEAESDQLETVRAHGMRVVHRLDQFGLLKSNSIAAHCIHLAENEIARLAETDTIVVHNPQSNLNNAVGIMDLVKYSRAGILVGMGSDAMTVDMTQEMRTALWCSRLLNKDTSVGFMEAASALYFNNRKIVQRVMNTQTGSLSKGAAADVIILNYDPPTPLTNETLLGHLVFGIPGTMVDTTIIAGRIRMQCGQLSSDIDEARILAKSRELAEKFWNRF